MKNNKHSILIIVPARAGSKGVTKKNMYPVNGIPLIVYTFNLIKQLSYDYCITTDDDDIIQVAVNMGLKVYFKRPGNLAVDTTKMIEVLKHSILKMEHMFGIKYEYIMLLQPTAPLRTVSDVNNTIELLNATETDSVISVNPVDSHHPALMKKIENGFLEPYCIEENEGTRRQDYKPAAYMRNGAIYLTKRDIILKNHSIWGKKITPYVMEQNKSISIDNLLDIYTLEAYLRNET